LPCFQMLSHPGLFLLFCISTNKHVRVLQRTSSYAVTWPTFGLDIYAMSVSSVPICVGFKLRNVARRMLF
jgi:hypothetical protein